MGDEVIKDVKPIIDYKEEMLDDNFSVEYQVFPAYDSDDFKDARRKDITESIVALDAQIFAANCCLFICFLKWILIKMILCNSY